MFSRTIKEVDSKLMVVKSSANALTLFSAASLLQARLNLDGILHHHNIRAYYLSYHRHERH